MLPIHNLTRISIDQYLLKLRKNRYPLLRPDQPTDIAHLIGQIKIRQIDQPSHLAATLNQKIVLLDHLNTDLDPCIYCNLPYSYLRTPDGSLCIFCAHVILEKPPLIYYQQEGGRDFLSTNSTKAEISKLSQILETNDPIELLNEVRGQLPAQRDKSLDEFF